MAIPIEYDEKLALISLPDTSTVFYPVDTYIIYEQNLLG